MPDTSTELAIATTTLSTATSNITFSSIPSTYTDLRIVLNAAGSAAETVYLQFNGNTSAVYSQTYIYGNGGTAQALNQTGVAYLFVGYMADSVYGANMRGLTTINVFSYAGSSHKTTLSEGNNNTNGQGIVSRHVGLWRNTGAITSIKLYPSTGNFTAGTTATLYGIN